MSERKAWKADKRALKQLTATNKRQRNNMKAYASIINQTREALIDKDTLRALALVSGKIKYPPDLLKGLNCEHTMMTQRIIMCIHCGVHQDD